MAVTLDLDDIQGIIAGGYSGLRHARFTVFGAGDRAAGPALLSWLLPQVTTAGKFSADTPAHVAFTAAGLRRLGLPDRAAAGFSLEFLGGMATPNPSPFLGDAGNPRPDSLARGAPGGAPVDGPG